MRITQRELFSRGVQAGRIPTGEWVKCVKCKHAISNDDIWIAPQPSWGLPGEEKYLCTVCAPEREQAIDRLWDANQS